MPDQTTPPERHHRDRRLQPAPGQTLGAQDRNSDRSEVATNSTVRGLYRLADMHR